MVTSIGQVIHNCGLQHLVLLLLPYARTHVHSSSLSIIPLATSASKVELAVVSFTDMRLLDIILYMTG